MDNIVDLSSSNTIHFRAELRKLYMEMAAEGNKVIGNDNRESIIEYRCRLVRIWRGKLLKLFRIKSKRRFSEISAKFKLSESYILQLEVGEGAIDDPTFFSYANFLGAGNEVNIFLERLEEAFRPGLSEFRKKSAETLRMHGFCFADSTKYEKPTSGSNPVLMFKPKGLESN